jgi:hypothetical protein
MIERPEEKDGVETAVMHRQPSSVPHLGSDPPRRDDESTCRLDVVWHRVHHG